MNMLYQLLLARKRELDYILLLASILILSFSIILNHGKNSLPLFVLSILSPLLLTFCIVGLWAWMRHSRYEYYGKRIRQEYKRVLHQQEYKLDRLTHEELTVLLLLLRDVRVSEIVRQLKLSYTN
ncbi:MAG: hypothetical protein EOO04_36590, partial [Chitinophagaceae bacterium]